MQQIKVELRLSRPTGSEGRHWTLVAKDEDSGLRFFDLDISDEQFSDLLSGSAAHAQADVLNVDHYPRVGKSRGSVMCHLRHPFDRDEAFVRDLTSFIQEALQPDSIKLSKTRGGSSIILTYWGDESPQSTWETRRVILSNLIRAEIEDASSGGDPE